MSEEPPRLVSIPAEPPGEGVVEILEEALERARNGEFSSVTVVWVLRDGACGDRHSFLPNTSTMLGAMLRCLLGIAMDVD